MRFDVHQLVSLGRVTAVAPSPDGAWLAAAVSRYHPEKGKYLSELWRVPTDGGAPTRLTRGAHDDRAPAFRADGALLFLSDREGDEGDGAQVWVLGAGEPTPLTDEPLGVRAFRVAGDALVFWADALPDVPDALQRETARDRRKKGPSMLVFRGGETARYWDAWCGPASPRLITARATDGSSWRALGPAAAAWRETSWDLAPDGTFVVATERHRDRFGLPVGRLVHIDVTTGARRVLADDADTDYHDVKIAPNGTVVASAHRHVPGEHGPIPIVRVDPATGAQARIWDGEAIRVPQVALDDGVLVVGDLRGDRPAFRIGDDGREVRLTGSGAWEALVAGPGGLAAGITHSLRCPPEPALLLPEPRRLAGLSGFTEADADAIADVTHVEYGGIDGFVVRPRGADAVPGLLWVHGGPIGAWSNGWHWRWNPLVFVAQGFAVALPNPRGSTGYGRAWLEGVWGNTWSEGVYDDVMAWTDAWTRDPAVTRVAMMGGSFGGYMANLIGGRTSRFAALVSHASIFDLSTFADTTDLPAWLRFQYGEHPRDRDRFDRGSPERVVDGWTTPTLILHGERDYRCPIGEGLSLYARLAEKGVDVTLAVFPDEGHWIVRPRNTIAWYEVIARFLAEKLA